MQPLQRMSPTATMEKDFYLRASNRQLVFLAPGEKELMSRLNGSIYLHAPDSITHLSDVDPQKIGKAAVAQKTLRDVRNHREAHGDFSWTLCVFPTAELAGQAGISLKEYTRQVVNACFLSKSDPVSEWRHIFDNARSIKKWLNSMNIKFLRIESDNIDLEITPGEKRQWIGISGRNSIIVQLFELLLLTNEIARL